MAFTPTTFVPGSPPGISAPELNKFGAGIAAAAATADAALPKAGGAMTGDITHANGTSPNTTGFRFGDGTGWQLPFKKTDGTKISYLKDDGELYLTPSFKRAWHDGRLRVHSSGAYIEWNNGGTWYPMGSTVIGASSTVQHSQLTEYTHLGSTTAKLVYKFVPLGTGDLQISADIMTPDSNYGTYIQMQVGSGEGEYGPNNYANLDVLGASGQVDWATPIGSTFFDISGLPGKTVMTTNLTSYTTVTKTIRVHNREPIYLYMTNIGTTGKIKNIYIKYDILG